MEYSRLTTGDATEVSHLFKSVFTASDSEEEGVLVADLAERLTRELDGLDVRGFAAVVDQKVVGAIFFSRMRFVEMNRLAFLLAPVAVHSSHQGQGIGQSLIRKGLGTLAADGVQFVATYGDPAFYSRVGFRSISEEIIVPPFPLSQPIGWLGQALGEWDLDSASGEVSFVEAFNVPSLW